MIQRQFIYGVGLLGFVFTFVNWNLNAYWSSGLACGFFLAALMFWMTEQIEKGENNAKRHKS